MIGQINKLDTRVILQRATDSVDAQGSVSKTWASLGAVWAAAEAIAATEATEGNARAGSHDYRFTVRNQSSISLIPADRVLWKNNYFDILSVRPIPEGRPDQIQIVARMAARRGFYLLTPTTGFVFQEDGASRIIVQ